MRLHRIVLLAATILLTNVYAVSLPELKVSHPSIRASGTSLTSDTTPKRLLRTQTATGGGVEERGALETLKNLLKSRQTLQLEGYLKNEEPVNQVFKNLMLDDIVEKVFVEREAAVQLLTSSKFKAWSKYIDDFSGLYAGKQTTLIKELTKQFDDDNLAILLQLAKTSKNKKAIAKATKLQEEQFTLWFNQKLQPDEVITKVFRMDAKTGRENKNVEKVYRAYMTFFIRSFKRLA